MAYIEPKTNWNEEYEPSPQDMNRIEGNVKHVKEDIDAIEARSITAGDGLSGGGTLAGNRTIAVDGSVARIEGSTNANITSYAVGTIVAVFCESRFHVLNSTTTLYTATGFAGSALIQDFPAENRVALSGTWRARGFLGFSGSSANGFHLFQRVS